MKTIPLSNGFEAIVDDDDFESLSANKWYASRTSSKTSHKVYAAKNVKTSAGKKTIQRMHSILLVVPKGYRVDHINGNTLDNRRCNLRCATQTQNTRNSKIRSSNKTGYKGVHIHSRLGRYVAMICINKKSKYLGLFDCPKKAHEAYCKAALEAFGEFANSGSAALAQARGEAL